MEYNEDDIEMCPILQDKLDSLTDEDKKKLRQQYNKIIKPGLQKKKQDTKKADEKKEEASKQKQRHPRLKQFQEAQGSCPAMNSSTSVNRANRAKR